MSERVRLDPEGYGPVSIHRPDIASALWWEDEPSAEIDRLLSYLGEDELLLTARSAWFKGLWGLMAVTTRRVLITSAAKEGHAFEMPIDAILGMWDAGDDDGFRLARLYDYEAFTKVHFIGETSLTIVHDRIYSCVRRLMEDSRANTLEKAHDQGVLDEFGRFHKLKDAFETGALDDESYRFAVMRIFSGGVQRNAPPGAV